jgi:hypothetical protein
VIRARQLVGCTLHGMSAAALFERVRTEGWALVEEWVREQARETLHLDFKQWFPRPGAPPEVARKKADERKQLLAKAVSGFANTEGGLLAFGIATAPGADRIDRAAEAAPIAGANAECESLRKSLEQLVTPPVPGLRAVVVDAPSGDGIIVVYVPASDVGPHRAEGPDPGRYYMRVDDRTGTMPHSILASMFGRRPAPILRVLAEMNSPHRHTLYVENIGRGAATDVRFQLAERWVLGGKSGAQFDESNFDGWSTYRRNGPGGALARGWNLERGQWIYPGDVRIVALLKFERPQVGGSISGRIDCTGAPASLFFGRLASSDQLVAVAGGTDGEASVLPLEESPDG